MAKNCNDHNSNNFSFISEIYSGDLLLSPIQYTDYQGSSLSSFLDILLTRFKPRVKLASCKSALHPPVVCSTDRSKAVVPVLVLLLVALWFILRGDLLYVFPCVILFVFFSPFSIAITSLGEERANLSAFRTFVRFVLV